MRAVARVDPILPSVRVEEHPARTAGRLAFGGLVDDKSLPVQLPLLPATKGPRVPLLELADRQGIPTMARGRGAPLDLRLAVASCLLTPLSSRGGGDVIVTTVRELRDFCYPNGWERRRDWPALRAALYRAPHYSLPGPFRIPAGFVNRWIPFSLRAEPGVDASLDDLVVIEVRLPPGSGGGSVIAGRGLAQIGVRSGPMCRAYIAANSVAWLPGVTRRPHPKNPRFHVWSSTPDNYADPDESGSAAAGVRD